MRFAISAALVLALGACANQPTVWVKDEATEAQFNQDKLECAYEAQKSVQSYDPSMRTTFGQELDLAVRRNEVATMCLRVRGYSPMPPGK